MSNHTVTLEWFEVLMAAHAGCLRNVQSLQKGRQNANGLSADLNWQVNIEGAIGELALAKYLNIFYSGKGIFRGDDVPGLQVRTAAGDSHRLILHPGDLDADIFVLVVGQPPTYRVAGWCLGAEGKRPEFWSEPVKGRPAFFVPQEALCPIELLPR